MHRGERPLWRCLPRRQPGSSKVRQGWLHPAVRAGGQDPSAEESVRVALRLPSPVGLRREGGGALPRHLPLLSALPEAPLELPHSLRTRRYDPSLTEDLRFIVVCVKSDDENRALGLRSLIGAVGAIPAGCSCRYHVAYLDEGGRWYEPRSEPGQDIGRRTRRCG